MSILEDLEFTDDIILPTHKPQDKQCKLENLYSYRGEGWIKGESYVMKVMAKQIGAVSYE